MIVKRKEHSKKHDRPQRGRKGQQNESVWRPARTGKGAQIHRLGNRGWHRLRKLPRRNRVGRVAVPRDLHGTGGGMMENPIKKVRELLNRPRSSTDFSPAARYAVSKLCDYAAQEHEQREKAETMLCNERRKALSFSAEMARQERTIADLRQQLSFLRQAMQDAGM